MNPEPNSEAPANPSPDNLKGGTPVEPSHLRDQTSSWATTISGAPIPPPLPDEISERPGWLIGRYRLLEKLGEGGFGVVWWAEQKEPVKREVALKIIKLGMDTRQVVARFEAERQALALMDHPNIAKVLDAGATGNGRPFFVMELVRGLKITTYCDSAKLNIPERLDLFIRVCQAIQHAHQKGIIHRDIKPSNVLVTLIDGAAVPKVIDFGIAKAMQGELGEGTLYTEQQAFIGTPAYASPEQAEMRALDIDTRSDIYSLGVLLYELLTGHTPFEPDALVASGLDAMRRTIRETTPERPSTRLAALASTQRTLAAQRRSVDPAKLVHALRRDLDWIVMKCLEKDRQRRYETANALAAELRRYLDHEPVRARPPSAGYRLQKAIRRNKLTFAASGAVAAALLAGAAVSTWQAIRATQASKAEARQRRVAEAAELTARQNLYASDMLVAQQAQVDGNNLALAIELLNRHRPRPGEKDLRGWEWRYTWSLCQSDEIGTFATNAASIGSLARSPDGTLVSAAEVDTASPAVRIWIYPSGRLLATPETNGAVGSVTFSPDGKQLAFGTRTQGLKIWDIEAGREIRRLPGNYLELFASGLAWSPDGRMLAASGGIGLPIMLWDLDSGTSSPLNHTRQRVTALAFSPEGQVLASGGWDNIIRLWSVHTRTELAALTNSAPVQCLAFSPDGTTLVSGDWDKQIRVWDLGARRPVFTLTNHSHWVSSVAFSPDQKTLASSSADALIKLWDASEWKELGTLKGSRDEIYSLAFSKDGKTLLSGSRDGTIKTWSAVRRRPQLDRMDIPRKGYFLAKDRVFLDGLDDSITAWDLATLQPIARYHQPSSITNIQARTFSQNGKLFLATETGEVVAWDLPTDRELTRWQWVGSQRMVLAVSPKDMLLAGIAAGKCLTVWDLQAWERIITLPRAQGPCLIRFSPDLRWIILGDQHGTVEAWDLKQKVLAKSWQAHRQRVIGLEFLPNSLQFVSASFDATAKLWDLESKTLVRSFPPALNSYRCLAISPDGERIAAGSYDGSIRLWSPATGQELGALRMGKQAVGWVQFVGPRGDTLAWIPEFTSESSLLRLCRAPSWEEISEP